MKRNLVQGDIPGIGNMSVTELCGIPVARISDQRDH